MNDDALMNYDNFLNNHLGQWISNYGGECVAEVAQYNVEAGKPIAWANAKDWADNPALRDAFDWIQNNPIDYNQAPHRGDIVVWSGSLPGSGGYGHVDIWDERLRPGVFNGLDQNWGGRNVHFQEHTYDYILGWWRPKQPASPPPEPTPAPDPQPVPQPEPAPVPQPPDPAPAPPPAPEPVPVPPPVIPPHPDPAPDNPVPPVDQPVPKPTPAPELPVHTIWNWLRKLINILLHWGTGLK